ncbi:hypothetical protein F6X40_34680 [Paraburkholderia sp. UCT31]|uniref:hypothetical protein n=1 Tax=Paraburkholderia sp. UCT31 TaxID=2615209 RepID=UPI0016554E1E|nr:hypothetical protein [Paraburkholderia sp. UCT31]MBC8741710.1 hypothetical protein [Paraburkholderia sp. UCT31]
MSDDQDAQIVLSADDAAVAQEKLGKIMFAISTMSKGIKSGDLRADLTKSVLSLTEYHLADLSKLTGINTQTAAEIEERHANIRAANDRVRELERKLGEGQSPERVQMAIRNLSEQLRTWWRRAGLGHISELEFTETGICKAKLSCHLTGDFFLMDSPTPVSDKECRALWLATMREQGFVLADGMPRRDNEIIDCDQSREALRRLITGTFPSAAIHKIENHSSRDDSHFKMTYAHVYIRKLEEIAALPPADRG